jgi:hypothetical protein
MLKLIKLECGDVALVVNDHVVMTADPSMDDVDHVETVAEALAVALDVGLIRVTRSTPDDEEWTWAGVLEEILVDSALPPTRDIEASQRTVAQEAYETFRFGEGATVVGSDGWQTDINSGHDDWVKIVYVELDDDDAGAPSHRVSFHAKFKHGSAALAEAYAIWCSSGAECGYTEPRPMPAASVATAVRAGSQP